MAKKDDDRARRLAAALRENLKRRKAQARGVAGVDVDASVIPAKAGTHERGGGN
jgi:hypothetical protein